LVNNLAVNGNEEQKNRFLPDACSGQIIGGMCMSEPNAGTDVLGMSTKATYDANVDGWILNGTKMWITNGTLNDGQPSSEETNSTGDLFLVYARTGPGKADLTQFIVERDMEGFTLGQKIVDKLGMRASNTAELVFQNVLVPAKTHVVGEVHGATLCMASNVLETKQCNAVDKRIVLTRRKCSLT
jgi:isovaleryl-CoA dehydrogenase